MKHITLFIIILSILSCSTKQKTVTPERNLPDPFQTERYSPNTLIVHYDTDKGKEKLLQAIAEMGATVIYDYSIMPAIAVSKPESMTIEETIEKVKQTEGVVKVERDRIYQLHDGMELQKGKLK